MDEDNDCPRCHVSVTTDDGCESTKFCHHCVQDLLIDDLIADVKKQGRPLRYTEADSERAEREWKATCGPHAIAAACGKTLDDVRPALTNYKGWMSPTQVSQALLALGVVHNLRHHLKTWDLCDGINRVQWEGKWLNPGVPARVAYFHTHWVAAFNGWVLCTACEPAKWIREGEWRHFHLNCEPISPFHITHHYQLPSF